MATHGTGFPVLLKTHAQPGISRVLEVDITQDCLVTVNDLITLVNKKLVAGGHGNNRAVALIRSVRLYGEQLPGTRPLAPLLLDKAGSIPRLVAHTKSRAMPSRCSWMVSVRQLSGTVLNIPCEAGDSVHDLKKRIQAKEDIPVEDQRLICNGKLLKDHQLLEEQEIAAGCIFHFALHVRDGQKESNTQERARVIFSSRTSWRSTLSPTVSSQTLGLPASMNPYSRPCMDSSAFRQSPAMRNCPMPSSAVMYSMPAPASKSFADVSNGSLLVQREFSIYAPQWRQCIRGLNIEGRCETPSCRAFNKMVIHRQGYEPFNLIEDTTAACPLCRKPIKPVTCGFNACFWKYEGVKESDDCFLSSPWNEALGNKYHRFDDQKKHGSVSWKSLLIVVKPGYTALPTVGRPVQTRDLCSICMEATGAFVAKHCGCRFHPSCITQWALYQEASMIASCPICRRSLQEPSICSDDLTTWCDDEAVQQNT